MWGGSDFMLKEIIKSSPNFIKKPAIYMYTSIPDYIKYGVVFRNKYKFLQQSQWWTKEKLEEYQMGQIGKLLNHAYETVPYYTRVFNERGLKPKDIESFEDLKKLPYLTKDIIRENLEDLISTNYKKSKLKMITTGGTTGRHMNFYIEPRTDKAVEWAYISNLWNRVGYNMKKSNRSVVIRGNEPQNGLYEHRGKELILSSFKLTQENMKLYLELVEDFDPDFIQAYPSSIYILSKYILRNNIKVKLNKLKCILCSSENLYDDQRPVVQQAFGVRVYSFYGHTEHACLAGECEESSYFHLQGEYGYTELINEFGEAVTKEDEIGEIVATGFNNYVIPFIRYKTGDLAVNTNEQCSCKRQCKLIKRIEGRRQEYFVDRNGSLIPFTASSDDALWQVKDKITCHQFIQNEPGKIILNLQSHEQITVDDIKFMIENFTHQFPDLELEVNTVDFIERTKIGKFKYMVQNLDMIKY